MTRSSRLLLAALLLATASPALAQQTMTPSGGDKSIPDIAPRDPGHTGVMHGRQKRATNTVEGIDRHLLREERDRPNIPGQAPSPSQTEPGGTAGASPPR
ncbi:MAG: hypothetical protein INR65_16740 [Gluconacetobacter diazotrophicus]|nr:hypothetical protein [Gluconacetobacter diazotrophicus]